MTSEVDSDRKLGLGILSLFQFIYFYVPLYAAHYNVVKVGVIEDYDTL